MPYEPKPYPKMKFHHSEAPRTVPHEAAERELGPEWKDSPNDVQKPGEKPEPQRVILSDLPKLNGDADTLIVPAEMGANDEPADPIEQTLGDLVEPKTGKKKK